MTDQMLYILQENFLCHWKLINMINTFMEYMIFPSSSVIVHSFVAASTGVGNRTNTSKWIIVILTFKKKILIFNFW